MKNDINERLHKVVTEIKNMKMNQTVGGDSWVVYRTEVTYTTDASREYRVRFSPETSQDFVAVCKRTTPDRAFYGTILQLIPDPNIKGIWWRPFQFPNGYDLTETFFIYSTVKGTVSIEDVTGQGLGI